MADFGQFRGFGDKLFQGQLPTQLGITGSVSVFNPDSISFFNRVTTAGGTLSTLEKTAIDSLVNDLQSYSLWTKMKAIYPMVGASAAACAQNLKSSSFTGNFTSGWTYASTGVTPNNSYFNTNLNANSNLSLNSNSISVYISTDEASFSNKILFGVSDNRTTYLPIIQCYIRTTINNSYIFDNPDFNSRISVNNNTTKGFYVNTRTANNSVKVFKNNSLFGSNTSTNTQTSLPNYNIPLAAFFDSSGYSNYANGINFSFFSIGDGLTDTESINLYNAVQTFQTILNRNV